MRIRIAGMTDAFRHVPRVPTAIFRIGSASMYPYFDRIELRSPLQNSRLYVTTHSFVFNDIEEPGEGTLFDAGIADQVIDAFLGLPPADELLIQCSRGRNRSPAVALALDQGFALGNGFPQAFPHRVHLNFHVYGTLLSRMHERNITSATPMVRGDLSGYL